MRIPFIVITWLCMGTTFASRTSKVQERPYIDSCQLLKAELNSSAVMNHAAWRTSYAPYRVICPSGSLIRRADMQLSRKERTYLHFKNQLTQREAIQILKRTLPELNSQEFSGPEKPIRIAIAISGGGYRAMLLGAGILNAFDKRNPETRNNSDLSGLLQATSYIGGISGGSWLVMSNFANDFKPVYGLKEDSKVWALKKQLLEGVPSFDPNDLQNHFTKSRVRPVKHEGFFKSFFNFLGFGKAENTFETLPLHDRINSTLRYDRLSLKDIFAYYKELQIEVRSKKNAGFPLSFTDYWGRALVRRILGVSVRTPGVTLTGCTQLASFKNHEQPFPVIGTIQAHPNTFETSENSHLFEITPYEFGSWDSYLNAFVPVKYLGSSLNAGYPRIKTKSSNLSLCISGFDNIGFITATSSSLFNHIFAFIYQFLTEAKSELSIAISLILKSFGLSMDYKDIPMPQLHPDYALYSPNPFYGYETEEAIGKTISESEHMYLVDGGDDGQNILFQSFLVKAREINVVLAYDLTADISNWPNGTTLYHASRRYHNRNSSIRLPSFESESGNDTIYQRAVLPHVPTREQIVKDKLNQRTVFLGCNVTRDYPILREYRANSSIAAKEQILPPLIVYAANADYGYSSNTSTFQLSYDEAEVSGMFLNGFNLATGFNSSHHASCISCALVKRHWDRQGTNCTGIPARCQQCFQEYCWHM